MIHEINVVNVPEFWGILLVVFISALSAVVSVGAEYKGKNKMKQLLLR